jgi:hypothetical protein
MTSLGLSEAARIGNDYGIFGNTVNFLRAVDVDFS